MLCNGVAVPVATPLNAGATAGPYRSATSLAACCTPSCHTQSPETVTARNFLPGYDRVVSYCFVIGPDGCLYTVRCAWTRMTPARQELRAE
jgi:hypothetical protein